MQRSTARNMVRSGPLTSRPAGKRGYTYICGRSMVVWQRFISSTIFQWQNYNHISNTTGRPTFDSKQIQSPMIYRIVEWKLNEGPIHIEGWQEIGLSLSTLTQPYLNMLSGWLTSSSTTLKFAKLHYYKLLDLLYVYRKFTIQTPINYWCSITQEI